MKSVAQSKAEAEAARARLSDTFESVRERSRPSALFGDVKTAARKRATQAAIGALSNARVRPVAAAGMAAASLAYLFRNPILKALRTKLGKGD